MKQWATEQEAAIARGDFRDPRLGDIKVGDWRRRVAAARHDRPGDEGQARELVGNSLRTAVGRLADVRDHQDGSPGVGEPLQLTRRARHKGRSVTGDDEDVPAIGAETIGAAVHLMSQLYSLAMKETPPIVMVNPFAGLELPAIRPHEVDFLEHDEADALFIAAGEIGPRWRILMELGTEVGLRPGELYGLHGHRVDWLRGKIQVIDVVTRDGLRQWPKSKKSHRIVPVPAHILEGMSALMAGRPRDALVFTAPEGGPVDDGNFRDRVLVPGRGGRGHPPLSAADHAPHRGELARDRRGTSV